MAPAPTTHRNKTGGARRPERMPRAGRGRAAAGARAQTPRRRSSRDAAGPRPVEHLRLALADHAHVERLARRFKALGDPTRSKLVFALSLGERCVSDLAQALGASLSATSHQLRILRDLEIVRVRRSGKSQLYALNDQAFGFCSPRSCGAWKSALASGPEHTV
jgi:DNA-binding transcriptional ArsR family regulator